MNPIKMRVRKTGIIVDVYNIASSVEGTTPYAVYWDARTENWVTCRLTKLCVCDPSQTSRNKASKRLTFNGTATCTDGVTYTNMSDAITHELELMEAE